MPPWEGLIPITTYMNCDLKKDRWGTFETMHTPSKTKEALAKRQQLRTHQRKSCQKATKRSERWRRKGEINWKWNAQIAQIARVLGSILYGKLLNLLVSRLEAKIECKIEEPENKFQKIKDEIKEFKEDVNDSINHVEHVLRN